MVDSPPPMGVSGCGEFNTTKPGVNIWPLLKLKSWARLGTADAAATSAVSHRGRDIVCRSERCARLEFPASWLWCS